MELQMQMQIEIGSPDLADFVDNIKNNRFYSGNCLVLTGEKYNSYLVPCIYGWRDEDNWLYIGKSVCGAFNRLTAHRYDKKEINDSCQIFIWFFPEVSDMQLHLLEKQLIWELNPLYNKVGTPRIAERNRLIREKEERRIEAYKQKRDEPKKVDEPIRVGKLLYPITQEDRQRMQQQRLEKEATKLLSTIS